MLLISIGGVLLIICDKKERKRKNDLREKLIEKKKRLLEEMKKKKEKEKEENLESISRESTGEFSRFGLSASIGSPNKLTRMSSNEERKSRVKLHGGKLSQYISKIRLEKKLSLESFNRESREIGGIKGNRSLGNFSLGKIAEDNMDSGFTLKGFGESGGFIEEEEEF